MCGLQMTVSNGGESQSSGLFDRDPNAHETVVNASVALHTRKHQPKERGTFTYLVTNDSARRICKPYM
jgi:hypothetical protein